MVEVSIEQMEAMAADVLDLVPEEFLVALDNLVIVVEEVPPEGEDLLGLYEGVPLSERSPLDYDGFLPDRITLFRSTLCAVAADHDELRAEVRITLLHELGHHFGLSEEKLEELGWQ